MKEAIKEVTKVEQVTIYVANDGTEFCSKDECERYEDSAAYALKIRLKEVMKPLDYKKYDYNGMNQLINGGMGDSAYYSVIFKTENQIKDFIAYMKVKDYTVERNSVWCEEHPEKVGYVLGLKYSDLELNRLYICVVRYDYVIITNYDRVIEVARHAFDDLRIDSSEEVQDELDFE